MVLGWAIVAVIIYGLFFFNPADKNGRTYSSSKSLKRLYRQEYGEPPHLDDGLIDGEVVFQCMGVVARHDSR